MAYRESRFEVTGLLRDIPFRSVYKSKKTAEKAAMALAKAEIYDVKEAKYIPVPKGEL